MVICSFICSFFFFSSRRRHTRCALVTGVQTCALPISPENRTMSQPENPLDTFRRTTAATVRAIAQRDDINVTYAPRGQGLVGKEVKVTLPARRSEEHTSELQSLMRISYAVFCLKKKTKKERQKHIHTRT